MAQSKILVGLEIGTSKTCMVVGEVRPDATATIIGIGEVPSAGVRKGEISDQSMARQCVSDAWQEAQDHADVDIMNVVLSVTGDHFKGENSRGSYRLPDTEDIIEDEHVEIARRKAEALEIDSDHFAVNREIGTFSIDGRETSHNPAGLAGRTLEVHCHVMHGILTRLKNSLLCVRQVPLEVEDMVFAPLAAAQMVLNRQQKEAGALLIDIGGGTADYICYKGGNVVASGCIPAGGTTINADIVRLTDQRVSRAAAEVLKCTEGNAFGDIRDRSLAHYRSELGMSDVSIPRGELNRIIRDRMADILLRIRKEIPQELWGKDGVSIYFSGGSSLMRGLDQLANYIFGVPVHQPAPLMPGQQHSYLQDPRYCTAIGLIRFAQRDAENSLLNPNPGLFGRIFNIFRRKQY